MALVEYLIARDGPPPRRGTAYDYLLAGDGLYLAAENDLLEARVPVASCVVRGLPPVYPACSLKHGRLPFALWKEFVRLARAWALFRREVLAVIRHPAAGALLEIHSHHGLPACFSALDDADETRLCLYGVVGCLDQDCPEVALRLGAYGHFLPLPWEMVFEGERGAFRDVPFEVRKDREEAHGLPD